MYKPRLTASALSVLGASMMAASGIPFHLMDSKFNGRGSPRRIRSGRRSNIWRNFAGATYNSVQFGPDAGFIRLPKPSRSGSRTSRRLRRLASGITKISP